MFPTTVDVVVGELIPSMRVLLHPRQITDDEDIRNHQPLFHSPD